MFSSFAIDASYCNDENDVICWLFEHVFEGEKEDFEGPKFSMQKLKTQTCPSTQTTVSMCWDMVLDHLGMIRKGNEGYLFLRKLKTKVGQIDPNNLSFYAL